MIIIIVIVVRRNNGKPPQDGDAFGSGSESDGDAVAMPKEPLETRGFTFFLAEADP